MHTLMHVLKNYIIYSVRFHTVKWSLNRNQLKYFITHLQEARFFGPLLFSQASVYIDFVSHTRLEPNEGDVFSMRMQVKLTMVLVLIGLCSCLTVGAGVPVTLG